VTQGLAELPAAWRPTILEKEQIVTENPNPNIDPDEVFNEGLDRLLDSCRNKIDQAWIGYIDEHKKEGQSRNDYLRSLIPRRIEDFQLDIHQLISDALRGAATEEQRNWPGFENWCGETCYYGFERLFESRRW
jgi:hypothetical protein